MQSFISKVHFIEQSCYWKCLWLRWKFIMVEPMS